jgi:MFS family permease
LGHLLGAFLGGWLCDRIGALRLQVWSLSLSGLGFLLLGQAESLPMILFLTLATAIASESFRPANGAALATFSPPELRTRAVALNRLALNLGFAVGSAIGGWLAAHSYAWLFLVDAVTCWSAALILTILFRGRLGETAANSGEREEAPGIHPLRDMPFLGFLALTVGMAFCVLQGWSNYPVYLKSVHGIAEARYGLLMAVNATLIIALEMIITHRTERLRPLAVVGFGAFLACLGFGVMPFGHGMGIALVSVTIWTFGEMLAIPAGGGFVLNRAGTRYRGQYMGLHTAAWGVAFVTAPTGGAWIYERYGADMLWLGVGIAGPLLWLGFLLLAASIRKTPPAGVNLPAQSASSIQRGGPLGAAVARLKGRR